MKNLIFLILSLTLIVGCQKQSTDKRIADRDNQASTPIDSGMIVINEVAYRAELENEYGKESDWIELYNKTSKKIVINEGELAVSDNPSQESKFPLPQIEIPANGYCIIWCDGEDAIDEQLHANFKLSSKGESVSLFYHGELLDQVFYDSVGSEFNTYKRVTDGADAWAYSSAYTIGASNSLEK